MAVKTVKLTGDLNALVGEQRWEGVRVVLRTNLRRDEVLIAGGKIHLGNAEIKPDKTNGTFELAGIVASDSPDINVADGTLLYQLQVTYTDKATRQANMKWESEWWELTADSDAGALEKAIYAPPVFYSERIAELQAMIDQGLKGPQGDEGPQGAPGGSDAETAQRVTDGPLTKAALSASFVRFVDVNGDPLPPGSVTEIRIDTATGEIDDIIFQEA